MSDKPESQPDGPIADSCDGYTDVGRMYYVDDIDGATLGLDLETGDGEWLTQHDVEVLWLEATPREVALARRLHETECDYQRQIARLVKERDDTRDALWTAATTVLAERKTEGNWTEYVPGVSLFDLERIAGKPEGEVAT